MKIDLGCGNKKKKGFIGIDIKQFGNVDIIHDLNKGIPLKSNSVDVVYTSHFLEHIDNPNFLMDEICRVLKVGGKLYARVPHWTTGHTINHKTYWNAFDFDSFTIDGEDNYYCKTPHFLILYKKLISKRYGGSYKITRFLDNFYTNILNLNQRFSERSLVRHFPVHEIQVVMQKIK